MVRVNSINGKSTARHVAASIMTEARMAKRKTECALVRGSDKRKPRTVMAWAGYVDGELDSWLSGFYDVEHLSVFKTRAEARRCHTDVRRVRIQIVDAR